LIERNPAAALADLDGALSAGVDAAQLIEQLFGYLRDCMVAAVGCPSEAMLYTSPSGAKQVAEAAGRLGLDTLLAVMQILDQTLSRMRYSTQGRILAELALVRIGQLEDLDELSAVISQLQSQSGGGAVEVPVGHPTYAGAGAKKKLDAPSLDLVEPSRAERVYSGEPRAAFPQVGIVAESTTEGGQDTQASEDGAAMPVVAITAANAVEIWNQALSRLSGMAADQARHFDSIALPVPNRLVIRFKSGYAVCKSACERPEQVARFEQALTDVCGQRVRVEFALAADEAGRPGAAATAARTVSPHQRLLEATKNPLVQRAGELFGAQPIRVDDPSPGE
jgi:DNA polymerase III subunit gamma/tau